ncbi:MAG: aspartate aminotransferase family protein [Oscillospiraceae bacterium]|nr:aspartate aminotransferase family protein [Oscillospiraceae bacterium]
MTSQELQQLDQAYIAHTYARFSLCVDRGQGATCWSPEGKRYIDFSSGIGVNSLGFCDADWVRAVSEQAGKLQHISNLYYTEPCARLAEMLCARTGMKKVFFCNSGAEANEGAIKTARKYSFDKYGAGRSEIIALHNSFHGRTMATLSATGQAVYHNFFFPFVEDYRFVASGDLEELKGAVSGRTCAVMMELIQGEGGVIAQDAAYVQAVAALCAERDLLLIVDEVQTGIGRTGRLLACEHYGIQPDVVTIAKGIGGGLPLGAVLFGEKAQDVLGCGHHGTTFGGNPVACAGGQVVLRKLDEAMLSQVREKAAYLWEKAAALPRVAAVTGLGLMVGIEAAGKSAKDVAADAIEHGLIVLTAKDKVRLLPPLTISYEELDQGLAALEKALQ